MGVRWTYGDAWEHFPIQPGETWGVGARGRVAVHDLFQPLPAFMHEADAVFVDPPWNQSNLSSFYTKASMVERPDFTSFVDAVFQRIAEIDPRLCWIEIGNQYVDDWERRLRRQFAFIERVPALYYRKHPTNLLRGSQVTFPAPVQVGGMDEEDAVHAFVAAEGEVWADFCMGRGLLGVAAYKAGKGFRGTELNPRRLANLLQRLAKLGAQPQRLGG